MTEVFQERIVAVARTFIGTPYRHQGSLKGVGCDCLGLIRGVWRELYGATPGDRFIHASEQAAVLESPLVPAWRRRIAGVFRFPETF